MVTRAWLDVIASAFGRRSAQFHMREEKVRLTVLAEKTLRLGVRMGAIAAYKYEHIWQNTSLYGQSGRDSYRICHMISWMFKLKWSIRCVASSGNYEANTLLRGKNRLRQ